MALIVNINIASPAPLTVSSERDDGLISPLNGCNGVAVAGSWRWWCPDMLLLLASSWCQEGLGARWPALATGHYRVTPSALCSPHNVSPRFSGFHTQHVTQRQNNSFSQHCCFYLQNLIDIWNTSKTSSIYYAPSSLHRLYITFETTLYLCKIAAGKYVQIDTLPSLLRAVCPNPLSAGPCAGWAVTIWSVSSLSPSLSPHYRLIIIIIKLITARPRTHDTRYPDMMTLYTVHHLILII